MHLHEKSKTIEKEIRDMKINLGTEKEEDNKGALKRRKTRGWDEGENPTKYFLI